MASRKYTTRKNNNEKKEVNGIVGLILIILSVFCLICLIIAPLFSTIGYAIKGSLLGIFGYFSYPFFVCLLAVGISMLRSMTLRFSGKNVALLCAIGVTLIFLLQTLLSGGISGSIDEYIAKVWDNKNTVGGLLFGILAFAIQGILTKAGAIIFYIALLLIFVSLLVYSALIASGVIDSKKKKQDKNFVLGASQPKPVQTVRNTGLYVDTIIPKQPVAPPDITMTEEGVAGNIRPDEGPIVEKYGAKKIDFEGEPDNDKEKARKILFGDKSSRFSDGSNIFASYGSTSSRGSSLGGYKSRYSGSSAGYDEQLQRFRKLSENTIPDPDERPKEPQPEPMKSNVSDSLIPEKDISSQYVGGEIINGDEVSARYQRREETKPQERPTVNTAPSATSDKGNGYDSIYTRPADDGRPPIINGDFFASRAQDPRFDREPIFGSSSVGEDKSASTKYDNQKREETPKISDGILRGEQQREQKVSEPENRPEDKVETKKTQSDEEIQKTMEERLNRLIQTSESIKEYLDRQSREEPEDDGDFISFGDDKRFDAEPQKPINPTITEFPAKDSTPAEKQEEPKKDGFDVYNDFDETDSDEKDLDEEPAEENDSEDNIFDQPSDEPQEREQFGGIINGDTFNATEGFNFITETEDLSENNVPDDINSGYYDKVATRGKTRTTGIKSSISKKDFFAEEPSEELSEEPAEVEDIADDDNIVSQGSDERPATRSDNTDASSDNEETLAEDEEQVGTDDESDEHEDIDDGSEQRFAEMQSYINALKPKKDKTEETKDEETDSEELPKEEATYSIKCRYTPPPLNLMRQESTDYAKLCGDTEQNSELIEDTLESLKFPAKVVNVVPGPAITRYELEIQRGIPIKKIEERAPDIAYALASTKKIRIEIPIPGKKAVGVEVPNKEVGIVGLKDLISSKEFKTASSPLTLAIGKDIAGEIILCNLEKMPHLLIAGSTNSGKSSCLNSIVTSIIYKASPEDVRIILIDPKQVEFGAYMGEPHLLFNDILKDSEQASNALKWVAEEMERRYSLFSKYILRNIKEYNSMDKVVNGELKKLPYIVIIIDEFNALMGGKNKDLEDRIVMVAQKARAAGMHLILATQRPSVDVITGTIKTNLPSRIAFAVSSGTDSRTILDKTGAEMLVGRGDMLYAPIDQNEPKRVQGAFIEGDEIHDIVNYSKTHNKCIFYDDVEKIIKTKPEEKVVDVKEDTGGETMDPLIPDILKLIIDKNQVSATLIQRRFSVGYARAARILDQMEEHQFVSKSDSKKVRQIYITKEMYEKLFGSTT